MHLGQVTLHLGQVTDDTWVRSHCTWVRSHCTWVRSQCMSWVRLQMAPGSGHTGTWVRSHWQLGQVTLAPVSVWLRWSFTQHLADSEHQVGHSVSFLCQWQHALIVKHCIQDMVISNTQQFVASFHVMLHFSQKKITYTHLSWITSRARLGSDKWGPFGSVINRAVLLTSLHGTILCVWARDPYKT